MMKKTVLALFLTVVIVFSLTAFVFADEIDSRAISSEEKELLGAGNNDILIRVFNGAFLYGFTLGASIDELTGPKYVLEEMIVSYRQGVPDSAVCYRIDDSVANKIDGLESAASVFAQYTSGSAVDKLEKKIKGTISSIVCLCGETSYDGIYVYYKTDKEDYVLYKEYASAEKTYLFPFADFQTVTKEYRKKKMEMLYDENGEVRKGGSLRLEDAVNVGKYEFSLNAIEGWIITIGATAGLAIAVFIVIRRVRSKARKMTNRVFFSAL